MLRRLTLLRSLGVAALGLAPGCRNACQDACTAYAEYAEECGFTVPEADLDACYERQSQAEGDDLKACREYGSVDSVRNQLGCDEVALYFGGGAGAAE